MKTKFVTVDVREEIRAGGEPFSRIMLAIAALDPDQRLRLLAPFEPLPLMELLGRQGFHHEGRQLPSGDWEMIFTRETVDAAPSPTMVELDVRGLPPPEPLVKILEAVSILPPGCTLSAHTDRRPMHLYAQITERGCTAETTEQPDGSHVTLIRHA